MANKKQSRGSNDNQRLRVRKTDDKEEIRTVERSKNKDRMERTKKITKKDRDKVRKRDRKKIK